MSRKPNIQRFGGFITGMVMPNIGAFIAWGLITACFIPTGWFPNEQLSSLVSPMITYMLPLLIAYTGGKQVGGVRGGVAGVIASMGCIVVSDIPMFLGAMILGPLGGYLIKKFDNKIEGKVPMGFEMVVNNFSLGILGMILSIGSYMIVGPVLESVNMALQSGIEWFVGKNLLPVLSFVNEPAKVLFLNNAIEQGIYAPLGMQQVTEHRKSIYFMLESSPGPGLGMLIAYWFFGKGESKQSAPTAMIIHFFGGIHEIYFPYVLANPIMIIPMIFGGMSGVITFKAFGAGLVAFPSPGSIFSFLAMTPKGGHIATISGIIVATLVSFLIASALLRLQKNKNMDQFEESKEKIKTMKQQSKGQWLSPTDLKNVKLIVFSCDAGMGSSAMGASAFLHRLQKEQIPIKVINTSIENIPKDADIVVVQKRLYERAKEINNDTRYILIDNYINDPENEKLLQQLIDAFSSVRESSLQVKEKDSIKKKITIKKENLFFDLPKMTKEEAITFAGDKLVKLGYVDEHYIKSMHEKERIMSTYLGNGIAIPHGTDEAKKHVLKSGIVFMHFRNGIDYDGNIANLVIGIAGVGDEHLEILAELSIALMDEEFVKQIVTAHSAKEFIQCFNQREAND